MSSDVASKIDRAIEAEEGPRRPIASQRTGRDAVGWPSAFQARSCLRRVSAYTVITLVPLALLLSSGCSRSEGPRTLPERTTEAAASPASDASAGSPLTVAQRLRAVGEQLRTYRFSDAERTLRGILRQHPDETEAIRALVNVLTTEGRQWEAAGYMFQLVRLQSFSLQDLVLLASPREPYDDTPRVEAALQAVPDDPLPALGLVPVHLRNNRTDEALKILKDVVARYPDQPEAQAQLGRLFLDLKREQEFLQWEAAVPAAADAHPDVWYARGTWAARHDQLPAAARCYWEAIRRDPNFRLACHELGLVLSRLGESDAADGFLQRAKQLTELEDLVFPIFSSGPDVAAMRKIAALAEQLGRLREAWGWHVAILSVQPGDEKASAERLRLLAILDRDKPPQVLDSANPAAAFDGSRYPLPSFGTDVPEAGASLAQNAATVNFVDLAEAVGIEFRYFDSWVAAKRELMLLETIGGGVAVLDYDNDGWPDLYFTQCCRWPLEPEQQDHLDRLYRNLGNGTFQDVTPECGIRENGYSQGVAAGDVDNDGFTDLYIANVGQNRLYRNNGDGTFSLMSHHQDTRLIWTTSALIADVNGDTLPDIYDVNYVTGEDVYTKHCIIDGQLRSCGPGRFSGELDYLYLNMGDGTWRDASAESGLHALAGRGLGIVAADFNATGSLDLYVTNDVYANFLLVNQSPADGSPPRYTDDGVISGVAYDRAGRAQASMGIACDDVNGDGLIDLLVANYYNDSNTLLLQQPGRLFTDQTREFGLRDPSFLLLTFGSQFLDGDLDGYPDLAITNGHVDDFRFRGEPWHMRPQYFRNVGGTGFEELQGDSAGSYFQQTYLGRGMALIDWNRDGREDFAVSNIAANASLATNETAETGHWLAVRLRGVQSARDPIGARVELQFAGRTRTRQLVGGSGFECSNQSQLIFGLGTASQVDKMIVTWPSGIVQEFSGLPIDVELILIEGRAQPETVPREP